MALWEKLPESVKPEQVRCALTAVIKRQIAAPNTFNKDGWLQIGFYGHQPDIAESYISTGSLYLCSAVFLPLGLPKENVFGADLMPTGLRKKYGRAKCSCRPCPEFIVLCNRSSNASTQNPGETDPETPVPKSWESNPKVRTD
jgi:hypothetical protein